jgi:uncharacterized protein (DUF58 family)
MKWCHATPIPTPVTIWLLTSGVFVAMFWGWQGLLLFDLLILIAFGLDYVKTLQSEVIDVERKCPHHLVQGIVQDIEILIGNRGIRPISVQVRDQTPISWKAAPVLKGVVGARSTLKLRYPVIPPERGVYAFGNLAFRVAGPFKLVLRQLHFKTMEEVKVYPSVPALRYSDLATYRRTARHWGVRSTYWRGDGREFETLREYVQGDDPRKIHWKVTARLDRPIVQELRPEKNQIVMILLDTGRLMSAVSEGKTKLDHALEAAAQLAHCAIAGGDQVGILAFADRVVAFVPPKRSPQHLQMILESVAALRPVLVESQYEQALLWLRSRIRRRSLVVIFTDILDEFASESLLGAVTLLKPRHLPLCVAIQESEWGDLLKLEPSGVREVYERTVLQEILRLRRKGLSSLIQKGALAMDLPPTHLSIETLKRYMDVKARGLL